MEGTVNYEGSGDVFFAFYNGNEQLTEMPKKGAGLGFERAECSNGASVEWDSISWAPKVLNITKSKTKCTLYFSANANNYSNIEDIMKSTPDRVAYDDTGNWNLRYVDSPNNYIDIGDRYTGDIYQGYYDSSTYGDHYREYSTLEACEAGDGYYYKNRCSKVHSAGDKILWQIIGVMNNMTIINEDGSESTGQSLVKIIRVDSLGDWSWDTSENDVNNGYGVNEWSQADIMKLLNPGYEKNKSEDRYGTIQESYINNSLYWNKASGKCYGGSENYQVTCDFSNNGFSQAAKEKIVKVRWNTGTISNDYSKYKDYLYPKYMYEAERSNHNGKQFCSSGNYCNDKVERSTTWDGYIGLMYPSDYGYAVGGKVRSECLEITMSKYYASSYYCSRDNWMYPYNMDYSFTITPSSDSSNASAVLGSDSGNLGALYSYNPEHIYPVAYLKPSVKIKSNSASNYGSKGNPFIIE